MTSPILTLLFDPVLPHTLNGVAIAFYAIIAALVFTAYIERTKS